MAASLMCAHMTSFCVLLGRGERCLSLVSLPRRALIMLDQGPTLMTSFMLSYLCKGPICKYSYIGIGSSAYEFVEGDSLVFSIGCLLSHQ